MSQTISPATTNDFLYSSRKKSSPSVETPSQLLWLSLVKDVNTPRKPGPISATNEILENRRQLRNISGLIFFPSLKIGFSLISLTLWSAKLVHESQLVLLLPSIPVTTHHSHTRDRSVLAKIWGFFSFPSQKAGTFPVLRIETSKSKPNKSFMRLETVVLHRESSKSKILHSESF